jgi:hypothetical protein
MPLCISIVQHRNITTSDTTHFITDVIHMQWLRVSTKIMLSSDLALYIIFLESA